MNKQNLLFFLNISLIICVFVAMFALPVFSVKAQAQYQSTTQTASNIQAEKDKLIIEMDKVKAGIINLMGEMVNMIAEKLEELTLEFNKFFKLSSETEEELENATTTATTTVNTTATTTEGVNDMQSAASGSQSPPIVCPLSSSGVQTYNVTTKSVPTISQIKIDPFDIVFNSTQIITATVSDSNPITSVRGIASTDTKTTSFNLAFTNGTWQGSWVLKDSVCSNFILTITASSNSGTSKVDLTFK